MTQEQTEPEGQDPLPPDEATPATANWALMEEINTALAGALERLLDSRVKKRLGGIDLVTMFMAIHNFHTLLIINLARQTAPTNPLGRKAFYKNARDTFVRRMDGLMRDEEDALLHSAIAESERARGRKEEPN